MTKITLTANVNRVRNEGKVRVLTHVTMRLSNGKAIAFKVLGGAYSEAQAIAAFRKNHHGWMPEPGVTHEDLATYAKVA